MPKHPKITQKNTQNFSTNHLFSDAVKNPQDFWEICSKRGGGVQHLGKIPKKSRTCWTASLMSHNICHFSKMVTSLRIIMTIGDYYHDARHYWLQALFTDYVFNHLLPLKRTPATRISGTPLQGRNAHWSSVQGMVVMETVITVTIRIITTTITTNITITILVMSYISKLPRYRRTLD